MKRAAPRSTLRKIIKKHKPQLRLAANADLLVVSRNLTSMLISLIMRVLMLNTLLVPLLDSVGDYFCVHLSFLLFLHRLAEEARTNAFENKSKIIKPEHAIAAAKVILKKSRG